MTLTTCDFILLEQLIGELKFYKSESMSLIGDNQITLHITSKVFHELTNTDRMTATLSTRKFFSDILLHPLQTQMINYMIFSPSLSEAR